MSRFAGYTLQQLLEERRANVLEQRDERDRVAREMLEAHIAAIDIEIEIGHRTKGTT